MSLVGVNMGGERCLILSGGVLEGWLRKHAEWVHGPNVSGKLLERRWVDNPGLWWHGAGGLPWLFYYVNIFSWPSLEYIRNSYNDFSKTFSSFF